MLVVRACKSEINRGIKILTEDMKEEECDITCNDMLNISSYPHTIHQFSSTQLQRTFFISHKDVNCYVDLNVPVAIARPSKTLMVSQLISLLVHF